MQKLFIIAICALTLVSCTIGGKEDKPTDSNTGTISYKADVESFSDKIKNSESFNQCMKEHANMCVQSVGMELAQKSKDPNFCQELPGKDQKLSCEFAIAMVNAQEQNNDKACDALADDYYKKECKIQLYKQDAASKKDINICNKIDLVLQSGSGTQTNGAEKDQCILQYIMNVTNSKGTDCERILDESSLAMCKIFIKNRDKESSGTGNNQ